MTPDLSKLRELLEKGTPGPWRTLDQYIDADTGPLPIATGWYDHMTMEGGQHHQAALANAALIVAAVNALPHLIAELTTAREALADVVNPLGKVQRDAEAQGAQLSGMAYSIANSLSFVQDIARAALRSGEKDHV
jgi:hypothetical protein